jgi:predicted O-methyltransferase YrrM
MKGKALNHSEAVYNYLIENSIRKPLGLDDLLEDTSKTDNPGMATCHEQGQLLSFLIKISNSKTALELGVFTGVGTLWMAEAVGENGKVIACDVNRDYIDIAKPHWEKAGVLNRIDVRLAPAIETLESMIAEGKENFIDFCYIDAIKTEYDSYYELCLKLMKKGGIIAFDNMFLGGNVADPQANGLPVKSIRALNSKLHHDERIDNSFLSIGDGLHLIRIR